MFPQDLLVLFPKHHPLAESPLMGNIHFCILCIRINLLFILSNWLYFGFCTLIVYLQIVVCYVFTFCGILLVLMLKVLFRLLCTFLLWRGCGAFPHQSSPLSSGQTMTSTTDSSCYHRGDDYSFGRELQCQQRKIILLPQWSVLGSPSHLFNAMTSSPSQANCWHHLMRGHWSDSLLPSTLCGLQNTVFLWINGSDKLDYYTIV